MSDKKPKQLSIALAPGLTKRIDTHTSIRKEVDTEPLHTRTIPLCSRFPADGSIHLKYNNPYEPYIGLFSFAIYFDRSLDEFKQSPYFIGLLLYAEFIHKLDFFNNVGMILYTDADTYTIVGQLFGSYEKVIFAITDWPAFNIGTTVERTILRCMRLQAMDAFPEKWICGRDADTMFPHELFMTNELYSKGYKGTDSKGVVQEEYRMFLMNEIGKWENQFLNTWLLDIKHPICLAVNVGYFANWHTNSVLRWPAKKPSELFKRLVDHKLADLYFIAPLGIFAGFTNFSQERPSDLWYLCYDYIIRRYSLITHIFPGNIAYPIISDDDSIMGMGQSAIGKDERILIFGILPKYVELVYFFWFDYQENIKYADVKLSNKNSYSSFDSVGISEKTLLSFGTIKREYPNNNGSNSTDINIKTLLLQPAYVDTMHKGLKLNRKLLKELEERKESDDLFKDMFSEIEPEELLNININVFFKIIFTEFIRRYTIWLSKYTTMSNSDFSKIIDKLKAANTSQPPWPLFYYKLTNANFVSPPGRILPSSNEVKFKAGIVKGQNSPHLNSIRNTARTKRRLAAEAAAAAAEAAAAEAATVKAIATGGNHTRRKSHRKYKRTYKRRQ